MLYKTIILNSQVIENSKIYNLVKNLTDKVYHSFKDEYDTRWDGFYLPLKRSGREISIPFSIVKYKKEFFCYFSRLGNIHVKKGYKETEQVFNKIFQEIARFAQLIKWTKGNIVKKQFLMIFV